MSKADNKIRIIDLLNKIANGEEVPQKIKIKEEIYSFEQFMDNFKYFDDYWYTILNDEVEILEDNTEEIEELKITEIVQNRLVKEIRENREKINELVKAVNSIRKDKNND